MPSASQTPQPFEVEIQVIPGRFTDRVGWMQSLGDEIAWVNGTRNLYGFVPGDGRPELIYTAPRGSYIPRFVGSSAGFAIITQVSLEGFDPPVRWRLWYLADAGEDPVLVDEYDVDRGPQLEVHLAIDERRIAWARTRGSGEDMLSELRVVDIDELDQPRTLLSYPFWDTNLNGPALNGDELWYGVRVNDWNAGTESPRVEMLDLAHPEEPPKVYGEDVRAFMPAANDEVVVWKGGGEPQDAADNWGSLYLYWRSDGFIERVLGLELPGQPGDDRIFYPSVGDRFVAWWNGGQQVLTYDLRERAVRRIEDYDPYVGGIQTASVADSLLAYPFRDGVRWALLPE